jgi:hypothetical protein
MRALEAAETLAADGVDVAVLHVPTIKPLDEATILREASRTGRMVRRRLPCPFRRGLQRERGVNPLSEARHRHADRLCPTLSPWRVLRNAGWITNLPTISDGAPASSRGPLCSQLTEMLVEMPMDPARPLAVRDDVCGRCRRFAEVCQGRGGAWRCTLRSWTAAPCQFRRALRWRGSVLSPWRRSLRPGRQCRANFAEIAHGEKDRRQPQAD